MADLVERELVEAVKGPDIDRLRAAARAVVQWNDDNDGLPADLWELIANLAEALD